MKYLSGLFSRIKHFFRAIGHFFKNLFSRKSKKNYSDVVGISPLSFKEKFQIKKKEFLENLKLTFFRLAYKLHKKGSEKLTVMIVPHSEKKIFNLQISNYIMFFFVLTLTIVISISIFSITDNQQISRQVLRLRKVNRIHQYQLNEVESGIHSLEDYLTQFKTDVSDAMNTATIDTEIPTVEGLGEVDTRFVDEDPNAPDELKKIIAFKDELEYTKNMVQTMGFSIADFKKLLQEIPSIYPLASRSARLTSPFGVRVDPVFHTRRFHEGIDLAIIQGVPIVATADGVVEFAGASNGYGNMVRLKHKYGFHTRYGHMRNVQPGIKKGQTVKQGQIIGYVGSTGKSTGPHVHYEVRIGYEAVDPYPYIWMNPLQ